MQQTNLYNEKEMLLRLSEGDESAFELIYNYYQPKLFLYIFPFTRNSKEETEEVIQEVFVKLWTRREALPAIESFAKYLFRMARNQFLDLQKKRKDYEGAISGLPGKDNEFRSPTHENIIFNEYSAVAKLAIDSLSPQRKKIFLLRYESDLSIDEIGETLKIARSSVKNQLYEAVKQVKDYLQKHAELPVLLLLLAFQGFPFR